MFAYKNKADEKKKIKHRDKVVQKSLVPMYVLEAMPRGESPARLEKSMETAVVLQRYPVRAGADKVECTSGRPDVPRDKEFLKRIYQSIKNGTRNAYEEQFIKDYPDQETGVEALAGRYRSNNGLAFCHKVSIDNIEESLVDFANTNVISDELKDYLKWIGIGVDAWLGAIQNGETIREKVRYVNLLIEIINETPENYYLGNAATNSSIQQHPDPHCGQDGSATPRSQYIMDNWRDMGIYPPKDDGSGGIASSSF